MHDFQIVADCGCRVSWIGEDELGNLAVTSLAGRTFVFRPQSLVGEEREIHGIPLDWFTHDHVGSFYEEGDTSYVVLSPNQRIALPEKNLEFHGASGDVSTGKFYLTTKRSILEASIHSMTARVIGDNVGDGSSFAHYEEITAKQGIVVAFQYGLSIWRGSEQYIRDLRNYSSVLIMQCDRIVAIEERSPYRANSGGIHTFNAYGEIVNEVIWLADSIYFLGQVNDSTVIVWQSVSSIYCGIMRNGAPSEVLLPNVYAECATICDSHNCVAVGTTDGNVVFWDTITNELRRVALPEPERIIKLFWSERRQTLFVGTRHGNVFAMEW